MYTTLIAARPDDPYLGECVHSVCTQTLPPDRVLVIIDAAEPPPASWQSDLTRAHPQVEIVHSPHSGMIHALNLGLAVLSTEYVAFLDSDDVWMPEKQERQIALLESAPDLDAAYCTATNFRTDADGNVVDLRSSHSTMFTCTTFRHRAFERFGPLDPEATHFTWLYRWWSHAQAQGIRSQHVDYVGVRRRIHAANSWTEQRPLAHKVLLDELRRLQHARQQP